MIGMLFVLKMNNLSSLLSFSGYFILITLFSIILLLISIVERNFRDITKNIVLSLYSVIGVCWILKAFSMGASDIVTFAPLFLITIIYSIKKQAGSWRKIKQYPEEVKHD